MGLTPLEFGRLEIAGLSFDVRCGHSVMGLGLMSLDLGRLEVAYFATSLFPDPSSVCLQNIFQRLFKKIIFLIFS